MQDFCDRFDVRLVRKTRYKPLQNALDSMADNFLGFEDDDAMENENNEILELLRQPGIVASLPDEMLTSFFSKIDPDEVPKGYSGKDDRRGLVPRSD